MSDLIKLGKYEIIKELGRGGFGIVYQARDSVLKRAVALKILHPALTVDPQFLARFQIEAELAAQMDHPNIVPIYDFNQIDGRYVITMGLMARGSLKDHLASYGAMNVHQSKTMLEQVASGLAYAHERDVIHRDLKPGNILIDAQGVARISDFGFAKARSADSLSLSMAGSLLGTPSYMAPEIWEGKPASPRSDIYSLGCIAHEMLTGSQLFQGETPVQVMHAHISTVPLQIEGISSTWQAFINRCLDKDPEKRYSSANALLEDLRWGMFNTPSQWESNIGIEPMDAVKAFPVWTPPEQAIEEAPWLADTYSQEGYPEFGEATLNNQNGWQVQQPTRQDKLPPGKARLVLTMVLGFAIVILSIILVRILTTLYGEDKNDLEPQKTLMLTMPSQSKRVGYATATSAVRKLSTFTSTPAPSSTPTRTLTPSPTLEPTLGIGSTRVRPEDDMVMVYVPKGTFTMGSNESDSKWDNERPEHEVHLNSYWIDKYEVSNAQYGMCVRDGSCTIPKNPSFSSTGQYEGFARNNHFPVVYVNWEQAKTYCEWVGGSLPTEAEWEKAARGSDGRKYPWGNENPTCKMANYAPNFSRKEFCEEGGSFVDRQEAGASPYGALNMAGNVWEWVEDRYAAYEGYVGKFNQPVVLTRVIRGGSWVSPTGDIRSTFRGHYVPTSAIDGIGFRCVISEP